MSALQMLRRLVFLSLLLTASAVFAADTPHAAWIKAKCAVCHGEDGAGNTSEGKRRRVPDLRSPEVQKHSDAELFDIIVAGHDKMPAFKDVSKERAALLVMYIRSLRKQ